MGIEGEDEFVEAFFPCAGHAHHKERKRIRKVLALDCASNAQQLSVIVLLSANIELPGLLRDGVNVGPAMLAAKSNLRNALKAGELERKIRRRI
jgi:hypothetical protein